MKFYEKQPITNDNKNNNNRPANHIAWFVSRASVSVMEQSCVLFRTRNWYQKKTGTSLTDIRASFWYQTTGTSFWYQFLLRVSPALITIINVSLYSKKARSFLQRA